MTGNSWATCIVKLYICTIQVTVMQTVHLSIIKSILIGAWQASSTVYYPLCSISVAPQYNLCPPTDSLDHSVHSYWCVTTHTA